MPFSRSQPYRSAAASAEAAGGGIALVAGAVSVVVADFRTAVISAVEILAADSAAAALHRSKAAAANFSRPSYAGARPSFIPQSRPAQSNFANFDRGNFADGNRFNFADGDRQNLINNFDRPTTVNRPNIDGGNRPDFGFNDRPAINNGTRPDWNDHPAIDNHPNINNRPNAGTRPGSDIWSRDWTHNGNWNHNADWRQNINSWANNHPYHPWYNHYDHWHGNWIHGYWPYWPGGYPWAWFGAGTAIGWWASPGTSYVYSNPYYVEPTDYSDDYYNYSQPIPPPAQDPAAVVESADSPTTDGQTTNADAGDANTQQAMASFNAGRALFKQGNYQGALDKVDDAITLLPSDATLHEFRGACLFALKRYQEAAATIYAVLAAGPGWDWDTMKALYPDTATYTAQLRALEAYKKAHLDEPDASFLLAYEYLVLGFPDQAESELEQVVKLQPNDKLSAAILQALQQRSTAATATPTPTAQ